jgi:tRNA threonylcarbamoyladenosine biosynthesis protein TsaB
MKVIAVETSTFTGSIAVVDDQEGLIAELKLSVRVVHSERLMPSIKWLLESSRIALNEIDAFGIAIGPGSFTGLRIGLSTVKGLSYATHKPIVPVPTLDAFARVLPYCSYLICPMLDARKREVYAALYKWEDHECVKIMDELAIRPDQLIDRLKDEKVIFAGEGAILYRDIIIEKMGDRAIFAPPSQMRPSAATVGEIAIEEFSKGHSVDPVSLTPFYIRKSEAEIRWKGSH